MAERSLELLLKIKAQNQQALDKIINDIQNLGKSSKAAGDSLDKTTSSAQKTQGAFEQTAGAARKAAIELERINRQKLKPDVGIGTLIDSARKASDELQKLTERNQSNIRSLERRAELFGKTGPEKLRVQQGFDLTDFGKTSKDIDRINAAYARMRSASLEAAAAQKTLSTSTMESNDSLTRSVVVGNLLVQGLQQITQAIKAATVDSALYAARTETLSIVNTQLAKANDLNVFSTKETVESVRSLGITTQQAFDSVNQLIVGQLDLAKATDLARLAQDAAVISGKNSSEALAGIINGIRTQQIDVLRTYGINVQFETAFTEAQRKLKRELTATEKQQIALNEVLKQAPKVAGSYEAALETTGKKLTSLRRFVDEAKNAIGNEFQPVLGVSIDALTSAAQFAEAHAAALAGLAKAAVFATGAFGAFQLGAYISSVLAATSATGGFAVAVSGLGAALVANPIGLALVAIGSGAAILYSRMQEIKGQFSTLFDLDDSQSKQLRETLAGIAEEMKNGTKTAEDFKTAVQNALKQSDPSSTKRSLLSGDSLDNAQDPRKRGSFSNLRFREFVRERFAQDPDQLELLVKEGNKTGTAVAKAMQEAFEAEFNPKFDASSLPIKVKTPRSAEDIKAEKEKLEKELAKAQKDVDELTRRQYESEFSGIQKINAERRTTIEQLGKSASLIDQINAIFDRAVVSETKNTLENALGLSQGTLRNLKTAADLTAAIQKAANQTLRNNTIDVARKIDPETFGAKDDIKYGTEAYKKSADALSFSLSRAIARDEEFLRDAKRVLDAYRAIEEARASAAVDSIRSDAARQERLLNLTTTPGSEAGTGARIAALRTQVAIREAQENDKAAKARMEALVAEAKTENDRIAANLRYRAEGIRIESDLRQRLLDIEQNRTEQILQLRNDQIDKFGENIGRVFDAGIASGREGVAEIGRNFVRTIQRTLAVNASQELFRAAQGKLSTALPGQTDGQGNLNLLGRLLRGTPLGVDPAALLQEANTNATKDNTAATQTLTAVMLGGRSGGFSSAVGGANGSLLNELGIFGSDTNGITGQGSSIGRATTAAKAKSGLGNFLSGLTSTITGGLFSGLRSGDRSVVTGDGRATTASALGLTTTSGRLGNLAGSIGATAAAGFGIYNGIQRGGVGGFAQAGSSALGLAAMIPGPQQGFLQLASVLTGFLGSIFGGRGGKERYSRDVDDAIKRNASLDPVGRDYTTDLTGNSIDYDSRGGTRVIYVSKTEVNVSTMDQKSFLDNSDKIADALNKEINGGNTPLRTSIQAAAFA